MTDLLEVRPDPGAEPPPDPPPSWRRRLALTGVVVVVLAAVVTWLIGWSPVLGASTVQVTGTRALTADQVRTAAAIAPGTPLVRLDTAAVVRRVETLPGVADATVAVTYPSTVTVHVTERVAVLVRSDPPRLVDATGRVFRTVPTRPAGLPVTTAPAALVPAAATVAGALPAPTRAAVAAVDVVTRDAVVSVTLQLQDGRTVLWGDTSRSTEKAQLLTALLTPVAGGAAPAVDGSTIDLRAPDVVVTR